MIRDIKNTRDEIDYIFTTSRNEDEAIFRCLDAGIKPSMIPPIRDFDQSEVIELLCSYIRAEGF